MNWSLLLNSLEVAGLTAAGACALGLCGALWLAGLAQPWRSRFLGLAVVALVLPPFLVTNTWLDVAALASRWLPGLPLWLRSPVGAAWVLALLTWPLPMLAALTAWTGLQPSQLESEPLLRGPALVRWLLWPMARGALAQAAVIVFVLALNNFTVPTLLQVKVFPAEVWVRFNTNFDTLGALRLSWPLVVAPTVLLLGLRRRQVAWPRLEADAAASALRQQLGRGWWTGCGVLSGLLLAVAVGVPVLELAGRLRTWLELPAVLRTGGGAAWNSAWSAALVATSCVGVGLLTWRWRLGPWVWLPFLVPGVLLGIGLIWLLNRPGLVGFYQSAGVMWLGLSVRYLALGWTGVAVALRSLDRDLVDAARLDGASGWQLFRWVQAPLAGPQMAAGWYITYLLCLWDVETLVLIVPPGGETLALRIFNLLHYGHSSQVNALCLVLLGLAVAPLLIARLATVAVKALRGRRWRFGPDLPPQPGARSVCQSLEPGLGLARQPVWGRLPQPPRAKTGPALSPTDSSAGNRPVAPWPSPRREATGTACLCSCA